MTRVHNCILKFLCSVVLVMGFANVVQAQSVTPPPVTPVSTPSQAIQAGYGWISLATDMVPATIAAFIGALATYLFGIRRLRFQLETELRNEYEIIRQRLEADLEKEYQSKFNERKWEVYVDFANIIRDMIVNIKAPENKQKQEQKKLLRKLYDFVGDLWIVGSDDVVLAYNAWRSSSSLENDERTQEEKPQVLTDLMQIIIEMRRDLGYESSKIEPADLLKTFINDFPE